MKKQNLLLLALLPIAFIAFFTSCKKQGTATDQCRITDVNIVVVASGSSYQQHLEYNSNGSISGITYEPYFKHRNFSYEGNYIYITDTNKAGMIIETDTVTLNGAGFISAIAQHYVGSAYYERMTYDGKNELIEMDAGGTYKQTYTWQNGNPITQTQNSIVDVLKYDTNKKAAAGDNFWFVNYAEWGAYFLKSSNLLTQFANTPITYRFGVDGKITSMTTQDPSQPTTVYTYTYTCN